MTIKLRNLICLQMTYCCAGLLYNVGSMVSLNDTGQPWAPTDPALGVFGMTVYLFFVSSAFWGRLALYKTLMVVALMLMGYNGVIKHVVNYADLELYRSATTWISAIVVNGVGTALAGIAALGIFDNPEESI